MAASDIEKRVEDLLTPIAKEYGCSVYDVDFAKEGRELYLTCYIDKESGVTIDDCEAVNNAMSAALDEDDFIPEEYTLVVSSPGLGRTLTKDRHFANSLGEEVDVETREPVITDPLTAAIELSTNADGTLTKTAQKKAKAKKKAAAGERRFTGILQSFDADAITITIEDKKGGHDISVPRSNLVKVSLTLDF